jgi:hypothetical protein
VGINDTAPNQRLAVLDSQSAANVATAAIVNTNATDSTNTVALRLGLGVAATTTNGRFIQFYGADTTDNGGTAVGHININNSAVNYATSGADFAEYYDTAQPVTTGDIVAIAPGTGGVTKATTQDILGVVSDSFGFSGNYREGDETNPNRAAVGLVGQIRTKVNTQNGPITPGDPIALSSQPGVGTKATTPGMIVGYALEANANADPGTTSTILVAIHPTYYDPNDGGKLQGSTTNPMFASLNVSGPTTLSDLTVTGAADFKGTLTVAGNATFNGDTTINGNLALSSATRGKNQPLSLAATTLTITDKTYPDANYAVMCTPSYDTTCYVTDKTATGFTLHLGTPAPTSATVDWIVIR